MGERTVAVGHGQHDLELVARAAAGDLAAGEVMVARTLLANCAVCADLERDLRSIAAATRGLIAAADIAATPAAPRAAPRDFRLTEADAHRLRPRGWLRLGRVLGDPRRARGLGGALAALGLVGLVVSAGIGTPLGGMDGATQEFDLGATKDLVSAVPVVGPASTDAAAVTLSGEAGRTYATARDGGWTGPDAAAILAAASGSVLALGSALLIASRRTRRSGP